MASLRVAVISSASLYNSSHFIDSVFRDNVRSWMHDLMPCMPMGLLSDDPEHWEKVKEERFVVEDEQEFAYYACAGCDDHFPVADDGVVPVCEPCQRSRGEGVEPPRVERQTVEGYTIRDTQEACLVSPDDTVTREDDWVPGADGKVAVFLLERDAEQECEEQEQRAADDECGEGETPWMHNWFFHPDRYIDTDMLQRAGFTVADYTGGSGGSIRLAGVNGVGYNHELEHYAALYVLYHFERGITIRTERGLVFVYPRGATPEEVRRGVANAGI